MSQPTTLSATQRSLVEAAERLFAAKGLGAVSTREIAREAGQKNHSAVSYHFGSLDALLSAILDFRMQPLNERRHQLLAEVCDGSAQPSLDALVRVIILPLADELLCAPQDSRYLRLLAQLMSNGEWQSLFWQYPHRSSALSELGELVLARLEPQLGRKLAIERLRLLGLHVLTTITEWDAMARRGDLALDERELAWRVDNLTRYLAAALTA